MKFDSCISHTDASFALCDFLANAVVNYTTRNTAPTLYLLSFLVFQLLFLMREFADLNAACFCFWFLPVELRIIFSFLTSQLV
jgi:hypothetical protein